MPKQAPIRSRPTFSACINFHGVWTIITYSSSFASRPTAATTKQQTAIKNIIRYKYHNEVWIVYVFDCVEKLVLNFRTKSLVQSAQITV